MFRNLLFSALFCLGLTAVCAAQDSRGNLAGTVMDSSGAVVPGAEVRATKTDTGVTARGVTNDAGKFNIPFLLPGIYRLVAEKTGFKTYSQDKIELRVADSLELVIRLEVGNIAETIEVHGGTPLLDTASSTIGQVMDERRMLELPQKGGNPLELARLAPGFVNLTNVRTMKSSSPSGTSQSSVDGTGTNSTLYNIDGVSDTTNDSGGGLLRVAFIPPSSAVTEFKMESSPYDASVGHVFGPVINISTKGGTNDLHGSLYDWEKNAALDAMNFFDNKAGIKKLAYQDHRYGASVAGPVVLPHLYDGHNKTFFLYAWEQNKWTSPANTTQFATVPTAAERTGDFSALLAVGSQYQVYNPFSTRPATSGRYQRDPFPGNIIPKSLLSTVGLNLATMWPLPNEPGTVDGQNNYFYPDLRKQSYDSHMGRIDQAFGPKNRLFLRLNHYTFTVPKNSLGVPATKEVYTQNNRGAALDDVIVLSPSLVLNLRYGVVSADYPQSRATQGTDLAALGFSPSLTKLVDDKRATVPGVKVGSYAPFSSLNDGSTSAMTHSWFADLTKLKGSHTLRFGVDVRLLRTFGNQFGGELSPNLSFSSTYTRGPLDNSTAAPIGQEFAEMLVGIPEGTMTTHNSWAAQDKYYGIYFQDDFKVNSKLTLNLGLRYEMDWPVTERYNRLVAGYDFADPSPVEAQAKANYAKSPIPELPVAAFSARGGLTWVNQNGSSRSPYKGNNGELLPRIGLAYQITAKTVLRAGYGIYFDTLGVDRFIPIQTGFSQSTPIQPSVDNGVTYAATLSNPFPSGLLAPLGAAGGLASNLGQAISVFDPNQKPPYSQRWSFGLQRFLPGQFLLDVSYVGNRSTDLGVTRNINSTPAQYLSTSPTRDVQTINYLTAAFPNPFYGLNSVYSSTISRANLLRPYPQFGDISEVQSVGYSWYHALHVRGEKRLSWGYTLQIGYTYSKYMQATTFMNPTDPTPYRVISDSDRPQVLTVSGLWEIPVGRGRRFGTNLAKPVNFVLGGWQFDAGVVRQAGAPLGFGNAIFNGDLKNIPLPKDQRSVDHWFNINAGFDKNSKNVLANNIQTFPIRFSGIRADGQATWNFSLIKNFRIRERFNTQFRAEAYNALNHPSFDVPNTTPTSSAFGTITNTLSEPREIQFALKITF
jgi:hypothetical protein